MSEIKDYVTYARTFENYKWYKPLITLILTAIIYFIILGATLILFMAIFGESFFSGFGGYESFNNINASTVFSFITLILFAPSLYIASKILHDRPFNSYSSSHGGWRWKLYFKCLIVPFIIYMILTIISIATGDAGDGIIKFSAATLIIYLILIPLQCISEEYMYRGLLLQTLGSWLNIPIIAIIMQAIIFGLTHAYNSLGVVAIIFSGIVYGIIAWKANGLEASSAIHTINNLTVFITTGFGLSTVTSTASNIDFIIDIGITLLCGALMLYIGSKYKWFDE